MEIHTNTDSGIYEIRHIASNTAYVGATTKFTRRRQRHFYDLSRGHHKNSRIQAAYDASPDGNSAFTFSVLEYREPSELKAIESAYIQSGDYGFNVHGVKKEKKEPAPRLNGKRIVSEETRRKISAANMGKKKHDEAGRKRISERNKGRKISEEHRQRIREANTGRECSEVTRAKISATKHERYGTKPRRQRSHGRYGIYLTPIGAFSNAIEATAAFEGQMSQAFLWKICKNPSATVTKHALGRCQYLQSLRDDCLGQTYSELGFGFQPK